MGSRKQKIISFQEKAFERTPEDKTFICETSRISGSEGDPVQEGGRDGPEDHCPGEGGVRGQGGRHGEEGVHEALLKTETKR